MPKLLRKVGGFFWDIFEVLITAFSLAVAVYLFAFQPHQVNGDSMLPNFHDGEYLLTDKISYRFREPQRGEVIVFRFPQSPKFHYIKRIIALPEEEIMVQDGRILIFNQNRPQGTILDESYLDPETLTTARKSLPEGVKVKVPEKSYIVMGDNRPRSSDSRTWGFIEKKDIVGRSLIRYWPPQAFAVIEKAEY